MDALRDRVRSFIGHSHWLTDGEWKESVLRSVLRRNLPDSVQIGKGFVITESKTSNQIDVLIYDSTKPVLFRDGDLVCITPDAVLGIIEVKTSLNRTTFKETIKKLCDNAELIESKHSGRRVYGLFSFKDETREIKTTLGDLKDSVATKGARIVHCICLGDSNFIRYWNLDPEGNRPHDKWHAYELT